MVRGRAKPAKPAPTYELVEAGFVPFGLWISCRQTGGPGRSIAARFEGPSKRLSNAYFSTIQMLRNSTGLPWNCSMKGPRPGASFGAPPGVRFGSSKLS